MNDAGTIVELRRGVRIDRGRTPLLAVDQLSLEFRTRSGIVRALENISFDLKRGETMALVGESGS
ncbi:MAG: ABC transporter ATP-binding protein, partial [Alphaproteobacteria bacterium]|nr:ABC transporter ATP-binding protein [Alphaproteobacteria bacterium]